MGRTTVLGMSALFQKCAVFLLLFCSYVFGVKKRDKTTFDLNRRFGGRDLFSSLLNYVAKIREGKRQFAHNRQREIDMHIKLFICWMLVTVKDKQSAISYTRYRSESVRNFCILSYLYERHGSVRKSTVSLVSRDLKHVSARYSRGKHSLEERSTTS